MDSDEKGLGTLIVWQKAVEFSVHICKVVINYFPEEEKYALTSQVRRSAQSIAANIAEGYGRYYYQEGIRFAYIARCSLEETYNHLAYAKEMGYFSDEVFTGLLLHMKEIRKLIDGYINYLKRTKRGIYEPGGQYYSTPPAETLSEIDFEEK